MADAETALLLARFQFAFTVSFHFIFPAFSIGLASYLMVLEGLWLKIAGQPDREGREDEMEAHRKGELEPCEQQCGLGIGHGPPPGACAAGSIGRVGAKSHRQRKTAVNTVTEPL
jgi:hypothetical protein